MSAAIDETIQHFAENAAEQVPGCALVTLGGSRAFGTDHPGSDLDLTGFYVAPTKNVLSLQGVQSSYRFEDRDVVLYELSQLCKLAASANPTVLEILWGKALYKTIDGARLQLRRRMFLSRRAAKTYGGYALAQLAKAERGTGGSRGRGHYERDKFLLHTLRLADAGLHVVTTGYVQVAVPDPEGLKARAKQPLDKIEAEVLAIVERMDEALSDSPLPEEPDWDKINETIYEIRMEHTGDRRAI